MKLTKSRIMAIVMSIAVAAAGMIGVMPADVGAATKLSVNRVYTTTTRVKGKTKKKYIVKIKIGRKTYKARASKKGKFSIKIPKRKVGSSFYVKAYKGKKLKYKKRVYVCTKSLTVNKFSRTSRYIKGYAKPKYWVKIKQGNKTYKKRASSVKGYYSIKLGKAAGDGKISIKLYNTKNKYVRVVTKKAYNAKKSSGNSSSGGTSGENSNTTASKLKVNNFKSYETYISGKTKPRYTVKITLKTTGKTYSGKADEDGDFKIKIPGGIGIDSSDGFPAIKWLVGDGYATIKVYDTSGKLYASVTKRASDATDWECGKNGHYWEEYEGHSDYT